MTRANIVNTRIEIGNTIAKKVTNVDVNVNAKKAWNVRRNENEKTKNIVVAKNSKTVATRKKEIRRSSKSKHCRMV